MKIDKDYGVVYRVRSDCDSKFRPVLDVGKVIKRRTVLLVTWPNHWGTQRYYDEDLSNGSLSRTPLAAVDKYLEEIARQLLASAQETTRLELVRDLVVDLREKTIAEAERGAP